MQRVKNNIRKNTMFFNNIKVFKYNIQYPSFESDCNKKAAESINEFYLSLAKKKEYYCKAVLYPQAVEAARYIQGNNPSFNYYEFHMSYTITLNEGCIVSLYMQEYTFMGGAYAVVRTSDTWNFMTGKRMLLRDLYGDNPLFKDEILKEIEYQISQLLKTSPQSFFDDYPKLLRNTFNLNSFYLTPDGIVIYFQQYDIAPYVAGFPEFLLPGKPFIP